jgi:hypothetical protein
VKWMMLSIVGTLSLTCIGCGEAGDLALSAGAPATAAVAGTITDCGSPVPEAAVVLQVQQDESGQARAVDTRTRAVMTDRGGGYLVKVAPAFAIPGPAAVRLLVTPPGAAMQDLMGGTVEFGLAQPPRDTLRLDADLGTAARSCRHIP